MRSFVCNTNHGPGPMEAEEHKSWQHSRSCSVAFFQSHPQCGRKDSHLTKTLLKRWDPFNRIMNAKWILVLFVGMLMVLNISNADVDDEWLSQEAEFENRQPQKRSESLNLIFFWLYSSCAGIWIDFCERTRGKWYIAPLSKKKNRKTKVEQGLISRAVLCLHGITLLLWEENI